LQCGNKKRGVAPVTTGSCARVIDVGISNVVRPQYFQAQAKQKRTKAKRIEAFIRDYHSFFSIFASGWINSIQYICEFKEALCLSCKLET